MLDFESLERTLRANAEAVSQCYKELIAVPAQALRQAQVEKEREEE